MAPSESPSDLLAQLTQQSRPARRWLEVVRWLVRIACLAILTALVWPEGQLWPSWFRLPPPQWIQRLESLESARFVPALSPWIALSTLAASDTLILAAGFGLGVGLLAVLRRRWFCRWVCPMGVCTELAGRAGRLCRLRAFRFPPFGQWIALLTLGGALLGYPLLLWMDPLALWAGWISSASLPSVEQQPHPAMANQADLLRQTEAAHQQRPPPQSEATKPPGTAEASFQAPHRNWFAVGAAAVLMISFLLPGLWCGRLCPLGGLQEILWQLRQMAGELLKGVVRFFRPGPASPPAPSPPMAPVPSQPTAEPVWKFGRRFVLAGLAGAVWAGWMPWLRGRFGSPIRLGRSGVEWVGWTRRLRPALSKPLRPPGAAEEEVFPGLCIRCGNCIRACPSRIILPLSAQHGLAGFLTPFVHLDQDYCREDCTRCTQACPTGALRPILLAEKPKVWIGLAEVDMGRCLLAEARECFICRDRCPYQAIRTAFSSITYMVEVQIDPARCNGCGACQASCPTWPRAIVVQPR